MAARIADIPAGAGAVAVNARTQTVYVLSYFTGVLSVLDARTCRAGYVAGCAHPRATVHLGHHPWRVTVEPSTDTVYVTLFGSRTLDVIDGSGCNGRTATGCRATPGRVHVGSEPELVALDASRRLGFVTNAGANTVSVFDTTHCRGSDTSGCGTVLATVKVGSLPDGIAVDSATGTVYVTDNASLSRPVAVLQVVGAG